MPSSIRRLAADHGALYNDLPPNYIFPSDDTSDDLTQLSILLAGPQGTPYTQGLWRLHLKIPDDYPKSPPKATFRTRIWHPNVEETTGAVCVDTLKRDWRAELTLKDVLITISCLLIYPNPDSALNSAAGSLLQEDYEGFARQAKLMTSIHAPVPADLKNAVTEAKLRGEEAGTIIQERQEDSRLLQSRKGTRVQSVTMKKKSSDTAQDEQPQPPQLLPQLPRPTATENPAYSDNDENEHDNENDPSLSPSPVKFAPPSPRKNAHGKRPLSVLTMPMEPDPFTTNMETDNDYEEDSDDTGMAMTASEKNIAANHGIPEEQDGYYSFSSTSPPQRKSPKLSVLNKGTNASGRIRDDLSIFEDAPPQLSRDHLHRRTSGDGKENHTTGSKGLGKTTRKTHPNNTTTTTTNSNNNLNNYDVNNFSVLASSASGSSSASPATGPSSLKGGKSATIGSRKVSSSSSSLKQKPRIGIRRL